jgi:CheY-like chemotaxis protein
VRGRVLIIDDEAIVRVALRRILAREHDVTLCEGAREALPLLRQGVEHDVILCDLMMPAMSGMDLHAELARSGIVEPWRLIFLTGGVFTPAGHAFLETVPNVCLSKPFDLPLLRRLVNERVACGSRALLPRSLAS